MTDWVDEGRAVKTENARNETPYMCDRRLTDDEQPQKWNKYSNTRTW